MIKTTYRKSGLLISALAAILLTGCQSPWVVLQSADPNPIRNQKNFVLHPLRMDGVMVDDQTEENFKAKKNTDQLHNWEGDKTAINDFFVKSLTERAASAGISISPESASPQFTIQPAVIAVDNGYYTVPAWNAISRIKMKVTILDPAGQLVDEIIIQASQPFDMLLAPSSGGRLRRVAKDLGAKVAQYLEKRTRS